jgi:LysR family nitrogen assimilation transcriptional regulator
VTLTDAGKSLLPHFERILAEVRAARQHVQDLKAVPDGHVAVGITAALAGSLTPKLVETFRRSFPSATISVTEGLSANLVEWLVDGRIDIALLYLARRSSRIDFEELLREELMLVCGARRAAPLPDEVELRELSKVPLVLPCVPNGIRMLVEAKCKQQHVDLCIVAEVNALQSLVDVAEAGECCTILPASRAQEGVRAGKLMAARIHSPSILNRLVVGTAKNRPESRITRATRPLLKELVGR